MQLAIIGRSINASHNRTTRLYDYDTSLSALFIGMISLAILSGATFAQSPQPISRTQLGVAHIGGLYALSGNDYLNEGAAKARAIGARCIKVSLSLDTDNPSPKYYHFNSQWPHTTTLEGLADTTYFRTFFANDFDTYILTTFRPGRSASYWREEFSTEDERAEEECFAELTRYLLQKYSKSKKTFIFQNWEGDWAIRGNFNPSTRPTRSAIANMIRWMSARQRGVARARKENTISGARVFNACEVNLVRQSQLKDESSVTKDVLPKVDVDLVSYSAWDTKNSPAQFVEALAFIAKSKFQSSTSDEPSVYVGEFGMPESECSPEMALEISRAMLIEAQKFGCPYAVYWQLYCNEPTVNPPKDIQDYKGFWLIRPDGTYSRVCELFK